VYGISSVVVIVSTEYVTAYAKSCSDEVMLLSKTSLVGIFRGGEHSDGDRTRLSCLDHWNVPHVKVPTYLAPYGIHIEGHVSFAFL